MSNSASRRLVVSSGFLALSIVCITVAFVSSRPAVTSPSTHEASVIGQIVDEQPPQFAFTRTARGYAASVDETGLDLEVEADGTLLRRQDGKGALALDFAAIGRPEWMRTMPAGAPINDHPPAVHTSLPGMRKRVVIRDDGVIHGVTLDRRPQGEGLLTLELAIASELEARIVHAGTTLLLSDAAGEVQVAMTGPSAFDARGRQLPGRMILRDGQPRLQVDDTGATYPIHFEPVVRTVDRADASDAQLAAAEGAPPLRSFQSKVSIFVERLHLLPDGSAEGWFGYFNPNVPLTDEEFTQFWLDHPELNQSDYSAEELADFQAGIVVIPVGADNRFSPSPQDRGQTTEFASGYVLNAFAVDMSSVALGANLVWIVNGKTTTLNNIFPREQLELFLCENLELDSDGAVLAKHGGTHRIVYRVTNPKAPKVGTGIELPVAVSEQIGSSKILAEGMIETGILTPGVVPHAWNFFHFGRIRRNGRINRYTRRNFDQGQPTLFPMFSDTDFQVELDDRRTIRWLLNGRMLVIDEDTPVGPVTTN